MGNLKTQTKIPKRYTKTKEKGTQNNTRKTDKAQGKKPKDREEQQKQPEND